MIRGAISGSTRSPLAGRGRPLALRMGMVDIIARADGVRASSAYAKQTGIVGADVLRRWRTRGGMVGLIEGAGTRLDSAGGDPRLAAVVGSSMIITPLGGAKYRLQMPNMGGTFLWLHEGSLLSGPHSFQMWWRRTPGTSEPGRLLIQSQTADNTVVNEYYDSAQPDEWTRVEVTENEPGTADKMVFFDVGGVDIEVDLVQVEPSPYPTSWIPPEGTARAADDGQVPLSSTLAHLVRDQVIVSAGDSFNTGAYNNPGQAGHLAAATGCRVRVIGGGGQTSETIATAYVADTANHNKPLVVNCGYNDGNYDDTKANIATMVSTQTTGEYLIIGLSRDDASSLAYNADQTATYGLQFLDPHDVLGPDSSIWRVDGTHINQTAHRLMRHAINERLGLLGYLATPTTAYGIRGAAGTIYLAVRPKWTGHPNPGVSNYYSLLGVPGTTNDNNSLLFWLGNSSATNYVTMYRGDGGSNNVNCGGVHDWNAGEWSIIAGKWAADGMRVFHQRQGDGPGWFNRNFNQDIIGMQRLDTLAIGSWFESARHSMDIGIWYSPDHDDDPTVEMVSADLLARLTA